MVNFRQDANLCLFAQQTQLFACRRAGDVKRRQHHLLALARTQAERQLTGRRGLARTLQAGHQNHRWWICRNIQRRRITPKNLSQRIIDQLDDLLVRTD